MTHILIGLFFICVGIFFVIFAIKDYKECKDINRAFRTIIAALGAIFLGALKLFVY